MASGITVKKGKQSLDDLMKSLKALASVEVLAGWPEDDQARQPDDPGGPTPTVSNVTLAYIHDNGAPEQNIPARPFMAPAMEKARDKLGNKLGQIMSAVVVRDAGIATVGMGLQQVGIIASLSIKNTINEGIDPALADSTLRARARRGRKGAKQELLNRTKGLSPSTALAKPLVDTGQMRNAATYVIRAKSDRSK